MNGNDNEDEIGKNKFGNLKHMDEVGYFLNSYVGHADKKTRLNGASGGSVSHMLKWLLINGMIDKIVTVESTSNPEKLFRYTVVDDLKNIDRCAKSAYYPVEMSTTLKQIADDDARYAVVGLPCVIKAVELAKQNSNKLRKRILFTMGLVCAQTKTKNYAEFLIQDLGIDLKDVHDVSFRTKIKGNYSTNYAFSVTNIKGKCKKKPWLKGVAEIWLNDLFRPLSCYHCDDIFAECADVVFMDAWLPQYTKEYEGTSLILNRTAELEPFFEEFAGYSSISISELIKSQISVVTNKRDNRRWYDDKALLRSNVIPVKRIFPKLSSPEPNEIEMEKKRYYWAQRSHGATIDEIKNLVKEISKFPLLKKVPLLKRVKGKLASVRRKIGLFFK